MQIIIDKKDCEIKELKTNFKALENIVKDVEKETGKMEERVLNESL